MHWHKQRLGRFSGRCWWHFGSDSRKTVGLEWTFFRFRCEASASVDDEGWHFSVALPLLFTAYLSLEGFRMWKPRRKCIATWDGNREFWLTDERECRVSIHHGALWIKLWSKVMETDFSDPWWVRGVSFDFLDILFGRAKCETTKGESFPVLVPMPEASYPGTATVETRTWRRPRWPLVWHRRTDVTVDMKEPIPVPGKGENSWDCGEDGIYGYGCSSTDPWAVVARGVESATRIRIRYASANWRPAEQAG